MAEDYFEHGGVASVAAALAATNRLPIGLGVVAAPVRHPAVTAMEFATLAGVHPGRLMVGIGHGSPGWMDQMGLRPASPLGLLREAATAVRRLLAGEEITEAVLQGDGVFPRKATRAQRGVSAISTDRPRYDCPVKSPMELCSGGAARRATSPGRGSESTRVAAAAVGKTTPS